MSNQPNGISICFYQMKQFALSEDVFMKEKLVLR